MKDQYKTKKQLIEELEVLRNQFVEPNKTEANRKRTEEELRKASLYARSLIEASLDPLVTISSDGKIMDVNQATEQVTGITRNRLIGSDFSDYFTEPVRAREGYQRVLSEGLVRDYPLSIRHISGRTTDVLYNATIYRNEAGEVQGVFAAARDITERKQAEEKLRDSEVRYRDLIETARDVILTISPQGVFTSFNRVFETITGWSTKEWIGKVFVDLVDPNDVPKAIQRFKSVMEGQLGEPIELRVRTKYGGFVPGEFVASPQVKEGKVIGILGVVRDITERKRAEEALRQEKDFNQTLVQASPLFFVAIGPDGKTLMMNEAMLHALGYTTDEVVGKDYLSTFVPVADRERLLPIFEKLVNQKESTLNENRVLIKDGRELLVEWHGRPVFKANGELDYFIGVGIDITHRRQAEEKMAVLQDQLRQSQKMEAIGRLAGGVAHDFNNLLTVIKGYCQLSLAEMKESTPLRDALEVINKATEKAADLTRQLLAFSRRQIMEVRVLDLNTHLQNLDKMLRRIIGEDIELVTLLGEDIGRVKADPGQIEQVVMNLAVNAKDAMSKGGKLIIETANTELDEAYAHTHVAVTSGRYVMIAVSDTGAGMEPEVRDRVFEPFFTTKGKGKGTGLGLSTVYGIVKQSNGNIWVYSEPGKGTTFKIFLPRVDEPADNLRAQAAGEEFSRGSETILVVEDDKEVRNLAVRILKRQGYTVLDGSYGDEALNVCRNHQGPIHLLLTDVVMPGMSGRELAKRLESFHPEMKVLYMSGYTDDAIVMHGVLVQGVNYIQKPFTVDALAKKVREVLER
ncbi:MAG: PAS domain S-box protein [bacterium]